LLSCKNCLSEKAVKNGIIRGKQRYKCKNCGHNFTEGDQRTNDKVIAKKALCTILYSLNKASFDKLADIFDTCPSLVHRWITETGAKSLKPEMPDKIKEMKFDEITQFISTKKTCFDPKKPVTIAHGELWAGCSTIVILQHSKTLQKN